jgi:uncharacterized membrane protein
MATKNWIIVGLLIVYFLFTSGFIFEVTKSNATEKLDVPFSYGLSAERTGITDIATQDDINCLDWLNANWDKKSQIIGDYNSYCLITSWIPDYFFVSRNLRYVTLVDIPDDCYIFISSWNGEHQRYIEPSGVGLRWQFPLPVIKQPIAYQSGKALVYIKQTPKPGS